jgi:hypothetical protein
LDEQLIASVDLKNRGSAKRGTLKIVGASEVQ